jgi:molecular chaperone GrpE
MRHTTRSHETRCVLSQSRGAERITCVDQPFDPLTHEAVATAPAEGAPHRVLVEVSAGYRLHSRLLRAARVVVAVPVEPATVVEPATGE